MKFDLHKKIVTVRKELPSSPQKFTPAWRILKIEIVVQNKEVFDYDRDKQSPE